MIGYEKGSYIGRGLTYTMAKASLVENFKQVR
jgi:hypothetical protein